MALNRTRDDTLQGQPATRVVRLFGLVRGVVRIRFDSCAGRRGRGCRTLRSRVPPKANAAEPRATQGAGTKPNPYYSSPATSALISRTASRSPVNTARLTIACPMCNSESPGIVATNPTLE